MLNLRGIGSSSFVALLMLGCSADDPAKTEEIADGSSTGMQTATTGAGNGDATTGTTSAGPTQSASTSGGAASTSGGIASTSGATTGGGGSDTGPTTGGPGNIGFGFGAGGASASGGGGGMTAATTASTTGAGGCTPAVECEPELLPSTGDAHQDCVDRVNQFRVDCWCLPPLERWTEGEDCADQHAQYDSEQDEAHAGFSDRICDNGGNGQNECPGWGSETQIIEGCLQMMYDEGPPPSEPCNGQCFQEHGHFINMTNDNYERVACGFYTTPGGDVWSVQNFQ